MLYGGCATAPARQPVPDDARRALELLDARWHDFTDLRTLADIVLTRGRESHQLTGALLVKGPDSVRFEALSPLGQPLLLVTVHEGRLTAYDVVKNEVLTGPATAATIVRVLGLPLDADSLVAVLAGRPMPPRDLRAAELEPADGLGPSLTLVALTGASASGWTSTPARFSNSKSMAGASRSRSPSGPTGRRRQDSTSGPRPPA